MTHINTSNSLPEKDTLILPRPEELAAALWDFLCLNSERRLFPRMRLKSETPTQESNINLERIKIDASMRAATPRPPTPAVAFRERTEFAVSGSENGDENEDEDAELIAISQVVLADAEESADKIADLILRSASCSPTENDRVLFDCPSADLFLTADYIYRNINTNGADYLTSAQFIIDLKTLCDLLSNNAADLQDLAIKLKPVIHRLSFYNPEFLRQHMLERARILAAREAAEAAAAAQAKPLRWTPFRAASETSSFNTTSEDSTCFSSAPSCTLM